MGVSMTDITLQKGGPSEKYCFECGAMIRAKVEICPKCGVRQPMAGRDSTKKLVAALLAIFAGTFGIHKFYLGKVGQGILYLFFCWTGIPTVVGWIEGIIYLSTSDEIFERKYG
jgi:TM2 domain-containing membrane protein YozV